MNNAIYAGATYTYYAGNYIYKRGNSQGQSNVVLTFFNSEEGYIEPQFDPIKTTKIVGYNYTYQYKDHLGNIRLSYEDLNGDGSISPETEIKEENHYYPFGLKHKGYNNQITGRDHQYGYNGIEESNELGNNMLEMDMRQYDAAIARWVVIDPVTHHEYSPYQAFDNNPVFFADPSGADSEAIEGGTRYTGQDGKNVLAQLQSNYGGSASSESSFSSGDGNSNPFEGLSLSNFDATFLPSGGIMTMGTNGVTVSGSTADQRSGLEAIGGGFLGGIKTWEFTWKGYLLGILDISTGGGVSAYQLVTGTSELIENPPELSGNDYLYGLGFVMEKGFEALIFKRFAPITSTAGATGTMSSFNARGLSNFRANSIFGGGYGMSNISQRVIGNQILTYSPHALNRAISRGFSSRSMLNIFRNGRQTIVNGRHGTQLHYSLGGNTIIVNPFRGKIITMFSNNPGTKNGLGAGFFNH